MINKYILITGSAGFIGYHICNLFLKKGYKVIGIDNYNNYYDQNLKINRCEINKKNKNFTFYKANISSKSLINKIFKLYKIDLVINLAAQAGVRYSIENPSIFIKDNVSAYVNVLENCVKYNIKNVIYASSSSVYNDNNKLPYSEKSKIIKPKSLYGITKYFNEIIADYYSENHNINLVGLRFFTVYGEFGRPDMAVYKFTDLIQNNKPVTLFNNGNYVRDFTYVEDITDMIYKLYTIIKNKNSFSDVFNIGSGENIEINKLVALIEKLLSKKAVKIHSPGNAYENNVTLSSNYKILNFLKENGYSSNPTKITKGLRNFVSWYKNY
jgi:UDP-glucuronate 4-epimerase